MTDARAKVSRKRRISPIWFVPGVALALGIWMVIYTLQNEGPEITIVFSTAEGIEAGKTKIKLRNVDIGLVQSVGLGADLESVVVTAQLEREATPLLREDTQFWVVRPRVGKGGVSGLGTLLSGGYIQIAPGGVVADRRDFQGLAEPPVTPTGTPGLSLTLTSERAGSVSAGDPILYKGHAVGRVETAELDVESSYMRYGVFIQSPYDEFVTTTTRFWDASGISVRAGADGLEADVASIEALLIGGVNFGLPESIAAGSPVESGSVFELYESLAKVNEKPYRHGLEYVVRFAQSVRGLEPGAPVEYRGLPLGRVERIMVREATGGRNLGGEGDPIPVLLRLEPARLEQPDSELGVEALRSAVEEAVGRGMRASLATGSLVTGRLFIGLDIYPDEAPAEIGEFAGLPTIPTIATGLSGLELRISRLLDKLNALPLEGTVGGAERTLAGLDELLNSEGMQQLPGTLDETVNELQRTLASLSADSELQEKLTATIAELDRTLQSLRQVLGNLEEQPNALIFNRAYGDDPQPPSGSQ